jgi:hypothetical protein
MTKDDLLENIRNTRFLKADTKAEYIKRIENFCNYLKRDLLYCINHPNWFVNHVIKYTEDNDFGMHTADKICSVFLAVFNYNQDFKERNKDLFDKWIKETKRIKDLIDKKYEKNEPTERQAKSYVSFDELINTRNKMKKGTQERLLLFMYTEIPPVRNDYHDMRIYKSKPRYNTGNYIVIDKNKANITLNEFKTDKSYETIQIDVPPSLRKEILESLDFIPRDHLFVSTRTNKPYTSDNSFAQWANRTLKKLFNNDMSLTTLRHVYISRRDLELETKSGTQRKKIAKVMGHSLEQQQKYLWHSWLK